MTMLAIILASAAVVREREHGTMDHLLVMPVSPFEIAMSKIWANGLVIVIAAALSLEIVVRSLLRIPVTGSVPLFISGVAIYLFFATAIGNLFGDDCAHDAAARSPLSSGSLSDEHPFGQQHAARIHADRAAHHHGILAINAFRLFRSGDPFPRRRILGRLAAIPLHCIRGRTFPFPCPAAVSRCCRQAG
jgi:hypothetical protein